MTEETAKEMRQPSRITIGAAIALVVVSVGVIIAAKLVDNVESLNVFVYVAIGIIVVWGGFFAARAATLTGALLRAAGVAAFLYVWASVVSGFGLHASSLVGQVTNAAAFVVVACLGATIYAAFRRGGAAPGGFEIGEVVWAEVPFHDDSGAKDRPLVVVGGRRGNLVCVYATSQSKVLGHPGTMSIGRGSWDSTGRETFIDVRKTFNVAPRDVRRRGGTLSGGMKRKVVRLYESHN